MICKECPDGRRFAEGSILCLMYGIIIREDHEGTRKGCEEVGLEAANNMRDGQREAELSEDEWDAIDSLPGVFPEG